jgi:hypothetical protein
MDCKALVTITVVVLLAGCGESTAPDRAPAEERETVFDPLTDTLDRAAGVEDTVRERSEELRRRIEESEE